MDTVETWIDTAMSQSVGRGLRRLATRGGVMALYGPHGIGKSAAVRRGMVEVGLAGLGQVVRVVVAPSKGDPSPRALYGDVARALGLTVGLSDGATALAARIADDVARRQVVLVLDNAEELRAAQLPYVRYLTELLPSLALCGATSLMQKLVGCDSLRVRVRVPLEVTAPALAEVRQALDDQFSQSWIETTYEKTSGNWLEIWKMVEAEQIQAERSGRSTREAGGADAAALAGILLLKAA